MRCKHFLKHRGECKSLHTPMTRKRTHNTSQTAKDSFTSRIDGHHLHYRWRMIWKKYTEYMVHKKRITQIIGKKKITVNKTQVMHGRLVLSIDAAGLLPVRQFRKPRKNTSALYKTKASNDSLRCWDKTPASLTLESKSKFCISYSQVLPSRHFIQLSRHFILAWKPSATEECTAPPQPKTTTQRDGAVSTYRM